jgi:hypothetical protein
MRLIMASMVIRRLSTSIPAGFRKTSAKSGFKEKFLRLFV